MKCLLQGEILLKGGVLGESDWYQRKSLIRTQLDPVKAPRGSLREKSGVCRKEAYPEWLEYRKEKGQGGHRLPGMPSPPGCPFCHSQRGRLRHCEIIEAPFAYCENCMDAARQRWE